MRFTSRIVALAVVVVTLFASHELVMAQSSRAAEAELKAARHTAEVTGDLNAAIKQYQVIAEKYAKSDRATAAAAYMGMADCYRTLGDAQARKLYEQVVRDYADQAAAAAQARVALAELGSTRPAGTGTSGVITRPLPNGAGKNGPELLSPDGTKTAAFDFTRGQNLSVFDAVTKKTTAITTLDWTNSWAGYPVWSTDSRRLAYMQAPWTPDGGVAELRVATLDGRSRTVFTNTANPEAEVVPHAWSPDGQTILAVVNRKDKTSAMGLIALANSAFTPLRSFPWAIHPDPRMSPDGRFIAYVDGPAELGDIHVLSTDGRVDHRVINLPGDDRQPRWSPDGRYLAFVSNHNGASTLWAVAIKDGDAAGEPFRIKDGMQAAQLMDWTTRGLSYYTLERTSDIYTIPADPTTLQPRGTVQQLPYARTGLNFRATWSPDGKQLAFIATDAALASRRYVVVWPATGGDAREFLIPTGTYQYPNEPYDLRWFGDGRGLGFSGIDAKGAHVAFRLILANGQWTTDTLPMTMWTRLEWNDDGSAYFYARHGSSVEDPAIVERNFQDHRERIVYHARVKDVAFRELTLGPDRRSLAFALAGDYVVVDTITGQAYDVLKADPPDATTAAPAFHGWSPDGRSLVLGVTREGKSVLVLAPVRGGEQRTVPFERSRLGLPVPGVAGASGSVTLRWSPDGGRLAIGLGAGKANAFIIENPLAAVPPTTSGR